MKDYFLKTKWTIIQGLIFYGVYSLTSAFFPMVSQIFFDHYKQGFSLLMNLFLVFALLITVNLLAEYANRVWEWKLDKELGLLMRDRLFQGFISQKNQDFERQKPVDYVSVINNHVATVSEDYFSATIDLIKSLSRLLIFSVTMTYVLTWKISLTILVLSLLVTLLPTLTQKRLARLRKQDLDCQKDYNSTLLDLLSGYRYISPRIVGPVSTVHHKSLKERENKHFAFGRFRVWSDMVHSIGINSMNLIIFALSGYFLISGQLSLGACSAALLYTNNLVGSIRDVLSCVNVLNSSKEVVAELERDLQLPLLRGNGQSENVVSQLSIRDLYYERDDLRLSLPEARFENGRAVAITGSSGAGKSTFLNLLNGDLVPNHGEILLDGHALTAEEREPFIFTLRQEEHLFDADLKENITVFKDEELLPNVRDLIEQLPQTVRNRLANYSSISQLSGGEKQIISILRALQMDYPVLLMDEPFSHIDEATKAIILDFLTSHQSNILIEVTHDLRPENLAKYAKVLKVYQGQISPSS